MKDDMILSC